MATFYINKNKFPEAEQCNNSALQIITSYPHAIHSCEMAKVHMCKGRMHAKQQKLDQALDHFNNALNCWKVMLDEKCSAEETIMTKRKAAMAESNIAIVLEKQNRYREAVTYHQQAFDRLRDVVSIEDRDLRQVANGLVNVNTW